jgi:glycosyltransferase involved in cell wall biosynthesis
MRTEIVISTYNSPRFLRLTLVSLMGQTRRPDSVAVADDGSGPETLAVIEGFRAEHPDLPIRHVWHEDQGFRKNVILNRASVTSEADYLIFTDGDCLMSRGFVERHVALAAPDRFCCGSLIRLSAAATAEVTEADVTSGKVFRRDWLRATGSIDRATTWLKTMPLPFAAQEALDRLYPIRKTWMGSNASTFRAALMRVNGFDETMAYGGGDKEFGIRLSNAGVTGRHLRFTAPVCHLDHGRGYRDADAIARQRTMIHSARVSGKAWTEAGIRPGPQPEADPVPD